MMSPALLNGPGSGNASHPGTPRHSVEAKQPQVIEGEELIALLEDGRAEQDEESTTPHAGRSKRFASKGQQDRHEKLEKVRSRKASHGEGLGLSEGFHWLWGGSKYSGMMCMAASALCYSFMGLLVKLLAGEHQIPSFQTVMMRCLLIAVIAGVLLKRMGHPLLGSPPVRLLLLARAMVGFVALSSFFYSIQVLPLRDATILNFTMPVFVAVIARIFLHEKWGAHELAAQPWGRVQGAADVAKRQESLIAVVVALLAAAMGAGAYCLEPVVPDAGELVGMLLVGLAAFGAQVLLTRGLQLEKAFRASAMQYVKVIATYMLGVVFLSEIPTLLGGAGALLIAISAAFVAFGRTSEESPQRI
eukprot:jgi/Mesen1/6211/ME000320S05405